MPLHQAFNLKDISHKEQENTGEEHTPHSGFARYSIYSIAYTDPFDLGGFHPVLDSKSAYALKMSDVVRDENKSSSNRRSGD